jgi:hypothetical protein
MRSLSTTARSWVLLALVGTAEAAAQVPQGIGSPFSAYGFGDLFHSTQVSQALMGIGGVAVSDPFSVASANPASYPFLGRPVFEAGGVGRFISYKHQDQQRNGQRTELLGLSIGAPFARNKWGIGLGLAPVSTVGYRINDTHALPADDGDVTFQYSGDGGLNRAYIGVGRVLWSTNDTLDRGSLVSLGMNLNYLFGSIEEARKAYYPVGAGYYNTSVSSRLTMRSPVIGLGLQWAGDLKGREQVAASMARRRAALIDRDKRHEEDWINAGKDPKDRKGLKLHNRAPEPLRYRIGLTAELPTDMHARHSGLANTFLAGNSGVEYPLDTTWWQDGVTGTVGLPLALGVGFSVHQPRWTITAEYRRRDWDGSTVNVDGFQPHSTTSTQSTYGLGGTFHPAGNSNGNSFWERNTYRAGLRYTDDYLVVGDEQLHEMAASAGLSIPLMALTTRSRLHFGVEVGQRSSASGDGLRERFTNVYLGVAITPETWDQWFRKRRID